MPTVIKPKTSHIRKLTPRQLEILGLIAMQAFSYREIAGAQGISEQTVKNLMHSAFERTGAKDRMALVMMGMRLGWIRPPKRGRL
jgi:DNA-binding CsgD family transcriptional regulator